MISFRQEKKLWRSGYQYIVGLDEAGRGALAGPIVAAAVVFDFRKIKKIKGINDSKKLSIKKREKLFKEIIQSCFSWQVVMVGEKIIDRLGIAKANKLAFMRAIKNLKIKPDFVLIDGIMVLKNLKIPSKSIIKADQKIYSVAAASILAKVSRDNLMKRLSKKYPLYKFDQHKGYGTKGHYQRLKKYGSCPCHRQSFRLQ